MSNPVWDIETGADTERALKIIPDFDPSEVKVGNLKPENAAAKIAEAQANHQANWLDKAALRPETGRVLAIGILDSEGENLLHINNAADPATAESLIIETFWDTFDKTYKANGQLWAGYNSNSFDLPFLIIRSRILGVRVPPDLRNGRYFNNRMFLDLMDEWLLGRNRNEVKCSLGYVAKALNVGEKSGDGKDFAATYAANPAAALEYLSHDLKLTKGVGEKLGAL